MEASYIVII